MTKKEKLNIIDVWSKLHILFSTFEHPAIEFPKGKEYLQKKLTQEMWDIIDPMVCKMKPFPH